jgi:hypothetical protein
MKYHTTQTDGDDLNPDVDDAKGLCAHINFYKTRIDGYISKSVRDLHMTNKRGYPI